MKKPSLLQGVALRCHLCDMIATCATLQPPCCQLADEPFASHTPHMVFSACPPLTSSSDFFFFLINYLFMAVCVFVSVRGLSLVVASGGHSSSWCAGLSLSRPLLLRSTGSRRAGSAAVAHGPSRSAACGIFPDQGLNPCPLHWQADS